MYERDQIERDLKQEAIRISEAQNGAPVVIIVAGDTEAGVRRTMTASSMNSPPFRMRDLLGILEAAIQIETRKHLPDRI